MVATRQASSAAVGTRGAARQRAGARRQARRGAALGWAERGEARAGGWLGRLRSWARSEAAAREGEKSFSKYNFKEFLNAIFQILF